MNLQDIAVRRLEKIKNKIRSQFNNIIGLKVSGSIAEGHYFLLQFGDIYISSDYDVIVLIDNYPSEKEIDEITRLLSKPVLDNPLEHLILEDIDVKIITIDFPYRGDGVKVASVYDDNLSVQRHLMGGKIIFGEEYFRKFETKNRWLIRQIAYRIKKRKRAIDAFIDLGGYDRIATILGRYDISRKIRSIVSKYRNYHRLSDSELIELNESVEKIKKLVEKAFNDFYR
jgi:hypothetical protein